MCRHNQRRTPSILFKSNKFSIFPDLDVKNQAPANAVHNENLQNFLLRVRRLHLRVYNKLMSSVSLT